VKTNLAIDAARSLLDEVDTAALMRHVNEIAAFDRESGVDGDWRAADYVVAVLRDHGVAVRLDRIKNLTSMPGEATVRLNTGAVLECLTHAYAAPTGHDGVTGALVYLDGSDSPESVAGKIAVMPGLAAPKACFDLERRGAVGLIFINSGEYIHNMAISPVWGMPTRADLATIAKIPVVSINGADGATLKAAIESGTAHAAHIVTHVDTDFREVPLIVADVAAGRCETDRYVLLNGHLDAWHKGALDNATGNAAMIEIARILHDHRDELSTNVRIVFWSGHSNGRYSGSDWYADHAWEDIHRNAVVNFNIDSVGAGGATYYGRVDSSAQCFDIGWQTIQLLTGQDPAYARIARNGDQSFWGHGVPSLYQVLSLQPLERQRPDTFVPGLPWYWHTSQDLPEHIGAAELTLDTQIYLQAMWAFASGIAYPFVFARMAAEILQNLEQAQAKTRDAYSFSDHIALARQILELTEWFDGIAARAVDPADGERLKDLAMRINRCAIPVHYCATSPFRTDDALPATPFPGLKDLDLLHSHDSELAFEAHRREIVREGNRIRHMLLELAAMLTAARQESRV
jgi:hypothetical protein